MYGLIADDRSQAKRIERYLELPANRQTVYSDSSIKRYSKAMAKQLAIRLAVIMSGEAVGAVGQDTGSQQAIDAKDASSGLRVRLDETFIRFGPNRVMNDILTIMRVEAITPGEHTRNISWEYFSDHSEGAVEIVPEFGCEADGDQIAEDGIAHMVLRFPRFLAAGDSHLFMVRVKIHSTMPARPPVSNLAPISDMDQHTLRIQFHSDAIPTAVWKYSLLSHYEVRHAAYREQVPIPHDGSRFVSNRWKDLKAGRSYGMAWDWPGDDFTTHIIDKDTYKR